MSDRTLGLRTFRSMDRGNPHWVIARHIVHRSLRGAAIWGLGFGIWVISTVKAFVSGYPTLTERMQLAQSLQAFSTLMGLPHRAETVAGFTAWRVLVVAVIIGAIWGLQTSTGLLRGEEEAGRWELLLAGQTTKRWATLQALIGFGASLTAMFVLTALFVFAAGSLPGAHFHVVGSLLFALALVSGAAMFLAVGTLASQLSATRGQAATIAAVVLGAAYVVRMIADSRSSLGWLRWLSPIGWVEELRPLQNPQPVALAPIVGLVLVCGAVAVVLAGGRDLNASVLREGNPGRGAAWSLIGPTSLAVRMSVPAGLAWLAGVAGMAAVYGSLARSATGIMTSSPAITATLGRLGIRRATEGYLGVVFLMADVLITVIAASQVAALRDEEAAGRLDNLLVRPVSRARWLIGRLGVSLSLLVISGVASGFFTWLGMASQHTYHAQRSLIEAGLNAT
ncbi:MAG TPA: ABC transporter permease subunit, partial [Chloroflexota bacterium]|nr:ABC transporter permease subunit [Chloroflexota bacterium]